MLRNVPIFDETVGFRRRFRNALVFSFSYSCVPVPAVDSGDQL